MSAKEKIQVCIVENDLKACYIFEKVFEDSEDYDAIIVKSSGNDSTNIEKTREEDKACILSELTKRPFQILILDLLLRDRVNISKEKVEGLEFSGFESLLSLEIAQQLKNSSNKEFLLMFTSSSEVCNTHQRFKAIRDRYIDKVPEDAVFIFKPNKKCFVERFYNCPIDTGRNEPVCNRKKCDKDGCLKKQCFFELINKYYKDFLEKQNNE